MVSPSKILLISLFSFSAFAAVGLISYSLFPTESSTIAEISTNPTSIRLEFDPTTTITNANTTQSVTIFATGGMSYDITGADVTINYDQERVKILEIIPEDLTTTLRTPSFSNGIAKFAYGRTMSEPSGGICPMYVDLDNSGSCYNFSTRSCSYYSNGCSQNSNCSTPLTPCENDLPLPTDVPLATIKYSLISNLEEGASSILSVTHESFITQRDYDSNVLSSSDTHTIYPQPPVVTQAFPGDLNADRRVNLEDFNLVILGYGTTYSLIDFNLVVSNYNAIYLV